MRGVGVALVGVVVGCGEATPGPVSHTRNAPTVTVATPAGSQVGVDPLERCRAGRLEALELRRDDPGRAVRHMLRECAAVYAQPACRDGYLAAASPTTDPAQRVRILTDACRHAYCPLLAEPRPAMCAAAEPESFSDRAAAWAELHRAIVLHDHGPAGLERLGAFDALDARPDPPAAADAGVPAGPVVVEVGAWRRQPGCSLVAHAAPVTEDAPEVYLGLDLLAVNGRAVARGAALRQTQVARIEELYTALQEVRLDRTSRRPSEPYPGDVVLWVAPEVTAVVVKSAFQTAAFAGHPNVAFVACGADAGAP